LPVTVVDEWTGDENMLWRAECRGEEAVVKLFLDAGQARSRRQFDGQHLFAPLGIAPQPLWYDRYPEHLVRQVLVYRWLPGERWVRGEETGSPTIDPATLPELAHMVAGIHRHDTDDVRRFCPHPLNLEIFWTVTGSGLERIQRWLAEMQQAAKLAALFGRLAAQGKRLATAGLPLWQQARPAPVHGDLRPANLLLAFGRPVLVDWEMFGLGDASLEVARFLEQSRTVLDAGAQAAWLDHYLDAMDLPALAQRIELYRRLLALQTAAYLLTGLKSLTPADRADAGYLASAPFLVETLTAAVAHASAALGVNEETGWEEEIGDLVGDGGIRDDDSFQK
jgi:aminoglycoside phosphotransferase (APT) family kinase protein